MKTPKRANVKELERFLQEIHNNDKSITKRMEYGGIGQYRNWAGDTEDLQNSLFAIEIMENELAQLKNEIEFSIKHSKDHSQRKN